MSTEGLQLHPSQAPFLQERQRILSDLDQAQSRARRLEQLGADLPAGGHDSGAAFGAIGDPVTAVDTAVIRLEQAAAEIERHRGEIRSLEQEIAAIKSKAQTLMLTLVIAVIVIAVGLVFVIRAYM